MLKPEQKERLYCMLAPQWAPLDDYVDTLNDIIDDCDDQEDREELSTAIDYLNLAIITIQKLYKKGENK